MRNCQMAGEFVQLNYPFSTATSRPSPPHGFRTVIARKTEKSWKKHPIRRRRLIGRTIAIRFQSMTCSVPPAQKTYGSM